MKGQKQVGDGDRREIVRHLLSLPYLPCFP